MCSRYIGVDEYNHVTILCSSSAILQRRLHVNIDPLAAAGLVTREVRSGERDGTATRVVIARRTYSTDQSDLWDAVTNAERIPRWFTPVTGTLELGGRYQLEGNAGGVIEACAEPDSFAVTWEYGGSTAWLTVDLGPAEDGTTLQVAHEAPVEPHFWAQYGPGATGLGLELAIVALAEHLATGGRQDAAEQADFSASPEGAIYLQSAATDWADAAIADGADVEQARKAAEQSFAFYSPPPDEQSAE